MLTRDEDNNRWLFQYDKESFYFTDAFLEDTPYEIICSIIDNRITELLLEK